MFEESDIPHLFLDNSGDEVEVEGNSVVLEEFPDPGLNAFDSIPMHRLFDTNKDETDPTNETTNQGPKLSFKLVMNNKNDSINEKGNKNEMDDNTDNGTSMDSHNGFSC